LLDEWHDVLVLDNLAKGRRDAVLPPAQLDASTRAALNMELAAVAVATMTTVRTRDDERLVCGALERLAAHGMPIAVAERDSPQQFRARISRLPGVTLVAPNGGGLVGQIRASFRHAIGTGRPFILYTEPDKLVFFERFMLDFIGRAPRRGTGIVLASRAAAAFATFPSMQRLTETTANALCQAVIGRRSDYFYGPFLVAREIALCISQVPRTLGWGWRPFVFTMAGATGYPIVPIVGDYRCPRKQRTEGERDRQHRLRQLEENVRGLTAAMQAVSREE
jgi:hypothetical protein